MANPNQPSLSPMAERIHEKVSKIPTAVDASRWVKNSETSWVIPVPGSPNPRASVYYREGTMFDYCWYVEGTGVRGCAKTLSNAKQRVESALSFLEDSNTPAANKHHPAAAGSPRRPEILEKLKDPTLVWSNMLRGTIAKPSDEQIKHLYPHLFKEDASGE